MRQITHWSSSNVVVDDTYIYVESDYLSKGYYSWFLKTNPVISDIFASQGNYNELNPIAVGTSGQTLYVNLTTLASGGTVTQVSILNGKFTTMTVGGNAPYDALSISADASYVYWSTNSIYAAQRIGGTTGTQFVVVPNVSGAAVVSDGTNLFWTDRNTGNVSSTAVASATDAGAATTTLATGETLSDVPALRADATNVYWIDGQFTQSRCIRGVAKGGGAPSTVYCSTVAPQLIQNIAVDGTNVYFVDIGRGLVKVPISGGPGTVLVDPSRYGGSTLFPTGYGIAVDGTSVYWTTALVNEQGGVYQLTPK